MKFVKLEGPRDLGFKIKPTTLTYIGCDEKERSINFYNLPEKYAFAIVMLANGEGGKGLKGAARYLVAQILEQTESPYERETIVEATNKVQWNPLVEEEKC